MVKLVPNFIKNMFQCLSLKWVSKSTLKFQFQESRQKCIVSSLVWQTLNEGQNSSKSCKNRCSCLSLNLVPKSTFKTELWESQQKCIISSLVWPTLNVLEFECHLDLQADSFNNVCSKYMENEDPNRTKQTT